MGNLFKTGVNEMKISDATYAVDTAGMENYIRALNKQLIGNTKELLEDVKDIQSAIDKGWNGEAKDAFLSAFSQSIRGIENDLDKEEKDLDVKLKSLSVLYVDQNHEIAKTINSQSGFIEKM